MAVRAFKSKEGALNLILEGGAIDDNTTAADKSWSSNKIAAEIASASGSISGKIDKVTVPSLPDVLTDSIAVLTVDGQVGDSGIKINEVVVLDGTGKIPSTVLPSYVDDVVEYADLAACPIPGESGKIYVTLDTGISYRWSGTAYASITPGTHTHAELHSHTNKTTLDKIPAAGQPENGKALFVAYDSGSGITSLEWASIPTPVTTLDGLSDVVAVPTSGNKGCVLKVNANGNGFDLSSSPKADLLTTSTITTEVELAKVDATGQYQRTGVFINDAGLGATDVWTAQQVQAYITSLNLGSAEGLMAPVADTAALSAVVVTSAEDRYMCLVEGSGIYRYDYQSTATADTDRIISAAGGTGRWFKMSSTINDHSNLSGLQGGQSTPSSEFYHLTSSQYSNLHTHPQLATLNAIPNYSTQSAGVALRTVDNNGTLELEWSSIPAGTTITTINDVPDVLVGMNAGDVGKSLQIVNNSGTIMVGLSSGVKANLETTVTSGNPAFGKLNIPYVNNDGQYTRSSVMLDDSATGSTALWTASKVQAAIDLATSGLGSGILPPVADLTALGAIVVGSGQDKYICNVESDGLYRYNHGDTTPVNSPLVIASASDSGRWFKMASPLTNHNSMSNLQGGTTNEYYHLTLTQSNSLHSHANKGTLDSISGSFGGATSGLAGSTGLVPAPPAGAQNKFLRGNGNWESSVPGVSEISAAYTVASEDHDKVLHVTPPTSTTNITLPTGLPIGTTITIINEHATNVVALVAGAGASLRSKSSAYKIASQYSAVTVYHKGSGVWYAAGELTS